jgi:FkbM family methyltransferase
MIAQLIFNLLLSTPKNSFFHKILQKLRQILISINPNTLVNYKYHNYTLRLPLSHDYPFNLKANPEYSQNLGIIAQIIQSKYNSAPAIDVGANIGDSAQIISHYTKSMPILCVEGNSTFIPLLNQNTKTLNTVSIAECFVGETSEIVKPFNYLGTSRLEKSTEGIQVKTMNEVLTDHPSFENSKLLKIDTDGFDNKIIRASKDFIATSKPIIFFEYDPYFLSKQEEKGYDIFDFLQKLGYMSVLIFDNYGKFMFEVATSEIHILRELTDYFNRNGSIYMDICGVHQSDTDILSSIKKHYLKN